MIRKGVSVILAGCVPTLVGLVAAFQPSAEMAGSVLGAAVVGGVLGWWLGGR